VDVHEQVKNGNYAQIFGDLADDLNKLRLQQSQIDLFCLDHRDKLRDDGYGTRFLFTRNDEPVNEDKSNVFVARVFVLDGRLSVCVYWFSDDDVWGARYRYRIVTPQLAP
jgi:hypothetical protein